MEIPSNLMPDFKPGWTGPVDMDNRFATMAINIKAHIKSDFAQDGYASAKASEDLGSGAENKLHNPETGESVVGDFSYNEFNDPKTGEEKVIRWHTSDGQGFFVNKDSDPELFAVVSEYRDLFSTGERDTPRMSELGEKFNELIKA